MADITFFFRNQNAGFSIAKVFKPIITEVSKQKLIHEFEVPRRRSQLFDIIINICYVFRHRNKKGINHITGDIHYCIIGLIGCKSVLTIHDLSAYDFPKNPLKKWIFKLLWFDIPLKIASEVVCISNKVKCDLESITSRKDIRVIYNPVDSGFRFTPSEFNVTKPIILQVGTAWNKNLSKIIQAIVEINCHLRIIGKVDVELQNKMKELHVEYSIVSGLSDNEVVAEYRKCDIVCFCSLYEGFGMPIIEANAIGRCVITSLLTPMTEIAGNAACFVNPYEIKSIENGIKKIIFDSHYRSQLIANGFENIKKFQSTDISRLYIDIYNEILN